MHKIISVVIMILCMIALANDGPERFTPVVLKHGGDFEVRKNALPDLMVELMARTSVNAHMKVKVVSALDKDLFSYPLLFMSGTKSFPPFSKPERERLQRYLEAGGMVVIDDASGKNGGGFEESVRREMSGIITGTQLDILGADHALFRSFYLMKKPFFAGRVIAVPRVEGVVLESHTPVIFFKNDALGACERNRNGEFVREVRPGGELQRQEAFKFGINVIMYAMTLDYKKDAAHIKALMNRRGR